MRRIYFVLFVLLVAATSLNTTTVTDNATFSLEGSNYTVLSTLEDAINLQTPGGGRIFRVDDCVSGNVTYFCLESADNDSAVIEFFERDAELSLTRTVSGASFVGETMYVDLVLQNSGERRLFVNFSESLNGTPDATMGFAQNLSWSGLIDAGDDKSFSYEFTPLRADDYVLFANATSVVNVTDEETVTVDDFLDLSVEYTRYPTRRQEYNFSVEISGSLSDNTTAQLVFRAPRGVRIVDSRGFRFQDEWLDSVPLNQTTSLELTYVVNESVDEPFALVVSTTRNETTVTRPYEYALTTDPFWPLSIEPDFAGSNISIESPQEVSVIVSNKNNVSVSADFSASGVLVDLTRSLTIPANSSEPVTFTLAPNRSDEYGVSLVLEYEDANGATIEDTRFVRFRGFVPRSEPVVASSRLSGPALLGENESGVLVFTVTSAASGQGMLTWSHDEQVIRQSQVAVSSNSSYNLSVSETGRYEVSLNTSEHVFTEFYIVSAPAPTAPTPTNTSAAPREDEEDDSWVYVVGLLALIGGFVVVWRLRASRPDELLAQYVELSRYQPMNEYQRQEQQRLLRELERRLEENS